MAEARFGSSSERSLALEERLIDSAALVLGVVADLGKTSVGRHIGQPMLRSGTSPAPNYAEARDAESRADFRHKVSIVQKELRETSVWLRMILRCRLLTLDRIQPVMNEHLQLLRIFGATLSKLKSGNKTA